MSISKPSKQNIDAKIYTKKAFYIMWMPVGMPYEKTYNVAKEKFAVDDEFGIMEKGKLFGFGWIGVKVNNPQETKDLTELQGEFWTVEVIGSYNQLKTAYTSIMKEYPNAKEFYNVYHNSPKHTPEDQLRTVIWFR